MTKHEVPSGTSLPSGLTLTLYPMAATWGSLRKFVQYADAMNVPDEAPLGCVFDEQDELEGIVLGPVSGELS